MGHKVTHVNFLNRFLMQEKPEKGHMHFPTRLQLQATLHGVPLVMGGRGRGGWGEREKGGELGKLVMQFIKGQGLVICGVEE